MTAASLLAELEDLPHALSKDYVDLDEPSIDELAHLLVAVRDARGGLKDLYDAIDHALVASLNGKKRVVVEGVGEIEVKPETKRTGWDHAALYRVVVARALDERPMDAETGEALEPSWETVARVLSECAHTDYWRMGALRGRGIDPSEFVETSYGEKRVKLP